MLNDKPHYGTIKFFPMSFGPTAKKSLCRMPNITAQA